MKLCTVQYLEERDQLAVYRLFSHSAQLVPHGGAGGETCMDVLVTSADKPRPWKLFPRPEGLQILSLIDPFFDPFPNPFRILVLSQIAKAVLAKSKKAKKPLTAMIRDKKTVPIQKMMERAIPEASRVCG